MALNREYGNKVLGEVTLEQVYGGARGIKALVWEVCFGYLRYWSFWLSQRLGFGPRR
jgi:hypothetical protein